MLVTMILAALVVDLVFSALGLIPDARPTTDDVFGSIQVDYKLVLNVFATLVFVALIGLTDAPRRDRSGVRHDASTGPRRSASSTTGARTSSAPSTAGRRSPPARQVASRRTMAVTPTTTITPRSTAGCSRRP